MKGVMKALTWRGASWMTVDEVPDPRPQSGEALVHCEATGICGSEVEGYLGMMSNRVPPLVMGHEFAGTVTEVGESVDTWLGKRVAVNPMSAAATAPTAPAAVAISCPERYLLGVGVPGGFAATVSVPERCLFEMPAGMDARLGALAEPLANGVHAIRQGAPDGAKTAAVIGAGTIGLGCMQAACCMASLHHSDRAPSDAARARHAPRRAFQPRERRRLAARGRPRGRRCRFGGNAPPRARPAEPGWHRCSSACTAMSRLCPGGA